MQQPGSALVTGASRGIGRAIALALAQDGYAVVINYLGNRDAAMAVVQEIGEMGGRALAVQADVANYSEAAALVKAAEAVAPLRALVCNAGIKRDALLMRMQEEDFDQVIATNLKGAWNALRHAGPLMFKRRCGRVVLVSSIAGIMGNMGQTNYAAAKAGLAGLAKSAAREMAGRGVTVNVVAPGLIASDMTDSMPEDAKQALIAAVPMRRMGRQEEVAAMVSYLCSDNASYVTGQVIALDGGLSM